MARTTIKDLKTEFEILSKQYSDLEEKYKTAEEEKRILINKCTLLEKELGKLQKKELKKHNERNAGRKSTLTEEQFKKVIDLYKQGLSYGVIAKEVGLSKAYVYKLINKQDKSDDKKYTKEEVEKINRLRAGLREMGHTHNMTMDLEYEEDN